MGAFRAFEAIMSLHLVRQIDKLKRMVRGLGLLVEQSLDQAWSALEAGDTALAAKVIEQDHEIDQAEIEIEEECLKSMALYQPVAYDLRFVASVLKINTELERIGDLSANLAEQVERVRRLDAASSEAFGLRSMSQDVRAMLRRSLEALVDVNVDAADWVRATDDQVDAHHREMYRKVQVAIQRQPEQAEALLAILSVSRHLERIADHTVNIAEDVIYMARGDILRHSPT